MIRKSIPPWKDREHLATPNNIMKYEFACCKDCIYRKRALKKNLYRRGIRSGPCIWIMRNGKPVDLTNSNHWY